jgi:hypothetical protein
LTIPIFMVKTDDIEKEIWRHLKLFAYDEYTRKYVRRKLARKQIISCIEQAEEIYSVSKSISLITRPILLYFGMQRLAKALIFMRNPKLSLKQNIEKLRDHGLTGGGISDQSKNFLHSKIHVKKEGIFAEFSKLTTKNVVRISKTVYKGMDSHSVTDSLQESDMSEFLRSTEFEVSNLFSLVPELYELSYHLDFKKSIVPCYYSIRERSNGKIDTLLSIVKIFDLDFLKSSTKIIEEFKNCNEEEHTIVLSRANADKAIIAENLVESNNGDLFLVCPDETCAKISDINVHYLLMFLLNYVARYKAPFLKEIVESQD